MTENQNDAPESAEDNNMTPETFSLFDVLSGQAYPKDVVELYFDEVSAFELDRALRTIERADSSEDLTEQVKRMNDLREKVAKSKYTFYLTGIPDDMMSDFQEVTEAKFKEKQQLRKGADGQLHPHLPKSEQAAYVRYFNALVNSAHIERIVAPDGRVNTAPDVEQVAFLFDKAPTSQKEKLSNAIAGLRVSAETFEAQVGADFLAKP